MREVKPDSTETQRLLKQASSGDSQVFDRLFERYRSGLREIVAFRMDPRLLTRFDPSDVVQETQMEAFRRLPDYLCRRPMPFRLWLRKMAIERFLDLRRRHVQAGRRSVEQEQHFSDRSSCELAQRFVDRQLTPGANMEAVELASRIQRAIVQLSPEDQEVLLMRYVEGFSNREVAYLLEISTDAASKRHGRALLRLQKQLLRIRSSGSQP